MRILRSCGVLVLALVLITSEASKLKLLDITDYLYGVDDDLQARARGAIETEYRVIELNSWNEKKLRVDDDEGNCNDNWESPCPPSMFRSPSGICNNIRHPTWGARGSPFLRFLKPQYSDGISKPRSSVIRHELPSPMDIISKLESSSTVGRIKNKDERKALTSLTGLWAELVLRDIASPITPGLDTSKCCDDKSLDSNPQEQNHYPECYSSIDNTGKCRAYMRSVPSRSNYRCKFINREQMNGASSYLDGSDVYGTTDDRMYKLRNNERGLINILACEMCNETNNKLGYLYKLLLNEHNRIAKRLEHLNPHWDDAKLFFEARRAVVAQIQAITFQEFVGSILGESAVDELVKERGVLFSHEYSSNNKPGTFDAIALAVLPALTSLSRHSPSYLLDNFFINNHTNFADNVAAGLNFDVIESRRYQQQNTMYDHFMENVWNISALLIHASRDHGMPDYITYFNKCLNNTESDGNDDDNWRKYFTRNDVNLIEDIYSNENDIDLMIGGLLELPKNGAAVGPTFSCLLMEQFKKIKNSDRFWYENDLPPSSFSSEQLAAIRRVTLSGLICSNSRISHIQPMAFIQSDDYLNAKINCDRHSSLDLSSWKEFTDQNLNHENVENNNDDNKTNTPSINIHYINNNNDKWLNKQSIISPKLIASALKKAERDLVARKQLEYNSWLRQRTADPKSSLGTAASFSKANRDALLLANSSILLELATNEIINGPKGFKRRRKRQVFDTSDNFLTFPNNDFSDILQNVDLSKFLANSKATNHEEIDCPPEDTICDPTNPYRTFTGHCNNLNNPNYGKSLTTFARLLPPVYEDGVSKPRMSSVYGGQLPNPRSISTTMHPDISNLHNRYTLMVMQFAQFIDHDLTMTPIHKGFAESIPSCKSCDSQRTVHPECNPFLIPAGDHFFPTHNQSTGERMCFPSMRSLPGQQHLGPREQVNQNTGFLDASVIYGENICIANVLRSFNGRMNVTSHPTRAKDLLPRTATLSECKSPSGFCFVAGDGRASEQPGLTVMHTMWVREHNRIMEGIRRVNPHWDSEKMYQETRKIVSGMLQHITYNEFLPRILGWNAVSLYGLKLLPQGYYQDYSPTCNPSILTEFAAAAYRIGHSLLRPHLPRMDQHYRPVDPPILLRDGFFNVDMMYQSGMVDEMLRGLVSTPMETLDQFITGEVTNHLFENAKIPFSGVDLIALNIQRARDHGIPSYNDYRALCNLKRAQTFEDLSREMAPEVIARFKRIYASVDDIDLFPGGMSERPLQGGLVGPTFGCIIAIQFRQLRKCDRFWYETDDPNLRFTERQLAEIRKNTLAKVMCENMDSHVEMQRAVFDLPSNFLNPRVPCSTMAAMDFSSWRETRQGCQIGNRQVAVGESGFPTPCSSCVCTNEGTQCASLKITNCEQLLREASREAILKDDVCTAQCGFALAAADQTARSSLTSSVFSSSFASASSSSFASASSNAFSGFKFPNLSPFIQ